MLKKKKKKRDKNCFQHLNLKYLLYFFCLYGCYENNEWILRSYSGENCLLLMISVLGTEKTYSEKNEKLMKLTTYYVLIWAVVIWQFPLILAGVFLIGFVFKNIPIASVIKAPIFKCTFLVKWAILIFCSLLHCLAVLEDSCTIWGSLWSLVLTLLILKAICNVISLTYWVQVSVYKIGFKPLNWSFQYPWIIPASVLQEKKSSEFQ